jgi:hypothetical protein
LDVLSFIGEGWTKNSYIPEIYLLVVSSQVPDHVKFYACL